MEVNARRNRHAKHAKSAAIPAIWLCGITITLSATLMGSLFVQWVHAENQEYSQMSVPTQVNMVYEEKLSFDELKAQVLTGSSVSFTAAGIKTEKTTWTEKDVSQLLCLVYYEAGICTDETQKDVAAVVINRVKNQDNISFKRLNTIEAVIAAPGQYSTKDKVLDQNAESNVINDLVSAYGEEKGMARYEQMRANVLEVMDGTYAIPENVVYQANFKQGSGVWKCAEGLYFCYL